MILTRDKYIKKYVLRKKEQLSNPPINKVSEFILPRNSHLHYLEMDGDSIGIDLENPLLRYLEKNKIGAHFVLDYVEIKEQGFKKIEKNNMILVREYFRNQNRLINADINKSVLLMEKNLAVTNYGIMDLNYTYYHNILAWYFKFQNRWNTIFRTIESSIGDGRSHFIFINLPMLIPSLSQLKRFDEADDGSRISAIKKMGNAERLLIGHFYNWFDEKSESLVPRDKKVLENTFFLFQHGNEYISLNLEIIKTFIRSDNNPKGSYDLRQMRKKFVILLMRLIYGDVDDKIVSEVEDSGVSYDEQDINNLEVTSQLTKDDTIIDTRDVEINNKEEDLKNVMGALDKAEEEGLVEQDDDDIRHEKMLENLEQINIDAINDIEDGEGEQTVITTDNDDEEPLAVIDYKEYTPSDRISHEEMFNKHLKEYAIKGRLTPQQMRRMQSIAKRYEEIPDPKTGVGTLKDGAVIKQEDLAISSETIITPKINMVTDKSMLKSSLREFDKKYINNIMHKDIYNAVLALQRHGVAVQNYKVERVKKLGDEYDVHSIKIVPIEGEESTINFKVPVIDDFGYFQSRGIRLMMKKQRSDLPIRKISFDEVALTSYMSKMFVERSQFAAFSSERWLKGALLSLNNPNIQIRWGSSSSVVKGEAFDKGEEDENGKVSKKDKFNNRRAPLLYTQFARSVRSIKTPKYELFFNIHKLEHNFGKDVVKEFESTRDKQILLGKGNNSLLVLTNEGHVYECSVDKSKNEYIGTLFEVIGMDDSKRPIDCADLSVVSKSIPLGVVLSYYLGLGNLLKTLNIPHRIVGKAQRNIVIQPNEFVIVFEDAKLIVDGTRYRDRLIMAGFNRYKNYIKRFSIYEFDKPNVYQSVLAEAGLQGRYLRELNILREMWVDPITEGLLIEMNEPTDFVMLLVRACEMLEYDEHPEEMDRAFMRDRGHERISGFVYEELIKAIRVYDSNPIRSKAKVSLNPEAVWMRIIADETTTPIEESNPIHNLKDTEIVVYRGSGGRSSRTMNSASRAYSDTATGIDSECTVDNGDAGTVRFLTANPIYNSVRGTANLLTTYDETVNASCLNTSNLLAPFVEIDDMKRRNFVHIQNSRTTNSEGAHVSPVRTGYERVIPWRTSDLFATMATEEGVVKLVTDNAVVVEYKSGKTVSVELGKRDGKWAGKIIPHQVITTLKEGQKIKEGDPIAYNPMFFEVDVLGGTLVYKAGVLARVGLVETEFTFEDASVISKKFADKLTTKKCEERFITVTFDQEVNELVKVGDKVEYDTTLCILQNNIDHIMGSYDESVIDSLRDISRLTPRAKLNGIVTEVDAIYVGEIEEMTTSLQNIVSASDRKLFKKAKDLGKERVTGQKKRGDRYNGKILEPGTVIIRIVVDTDQLMDVGSKVVFSHQMKSVVSNIFDEELTTEDGQPYDALFSYTSFIKRIVNSGILVGMLNTYLVEAGKTMVEIYENG